MESMYLPTFPNVTGLKSTLLLNIFFSIGVFLLFFFLLWYFVAKYRGRKKLYKQLAHVQSQATHLGKQMLAQKMKESDGKILLAFFVEYLERFTTNMPYSSVQQLFEHHGFNYEDVDVMIKVLYHNGDLPENIKHKIFAHC